MIPCNKLVLLTIVEVAFRASVSKDRVFAQLENFIPEAKLYATHEFLKTFVVGFVRDGRVFGDHFNVTFGNDPWAIRT
eukprot:COSAG01_NODE_508_length_16107_cov_120.001187_17_plen_78_part_00